MGRFDTAYSKSEWMDIDNLSTIKGRDLKDLAYNALKYTRQTVKNLVKNVGETYALRTLLSSSGFDLTHKGTLKSGIRGKDEGQLREMIHAMQNFAGSKTRTKSGLHEWAERQRASLEAGGYTFQNQATDSELDWIYSMIRDVINAFGDMKSPPNIIEAMWELIMDNQDLTYDEIKAEAIRKIRAGEYDIIQDEVIWR